MTSQYKIYIFHFNLTISFRDVKEMIDQGEIDERSSRIKLSHSWHEQISTRVFFDPSCNQSNHVSSTRMSYEVPFAQIQIVSFFAHCHFKQFIANFICNRLQGSQNGEIISIFSVVSRPVDQQDIVGFYIISFK